MALPATAVGEVQTGGSDTQCSGFFNSARGGTDYTQQTTAQATGTVTSATTTVTATTSIFTAAMVGNYITDGTTYKEITAFTSGTIVTVDSAPSWTAATIYVGGAMASPGKAAGVIVAGNICWIKSGSYTISISTDNVSGGRYRPAGGASALAFTRLLGYQTTRGDRTGTRPAIGVSVSYAGGYAVYTDGNFMSVENVNVDGSGAAAGFIGFSGNNVTRQYFTDSCKASNCTTGFSTLNNVSRCYAVSCTTGFSVIVAADNCESLNHTGSGFANSGCSFCKASTSGGSAKGFNGCTRYYHCTANGGAAGIFLDQNFGPQVVVDCLASNATVGIDGAATAWSGWISNNAIYNCTTARSSTALARILREENTVTLTADPYVSVGTDNLALNNTPGGGAACRAAGIPGVFPGGATTGYLDIGAVQHQDSGVSSTPATPNFSGGFEN